MILEVPKQTKQIADDVLQYADEVGVKTRDITGKIY